MPFAQLKDVRIHYDLAGPADAPVLVFSNSLGETLSMWDPQTPVFQKQFRVLRYDTRGHGQSSVTPGPYTIEQLARDVLALLDDLHIDRVYFCGLSMGGQTGMWLALNAADSVPQVGALQHRCENRHPGNMEPAYRSRSQRRHEVDLYRGHGTLVFRGVSR